jgi:hypothetical protein
MLALSVVGVFETVCLVAFQPPRLTIGLESFLPVGYIPQFEVVAGEPFRLFGSLMNSNLDLFCFQSERTVEVSGEE